MRPLGNVLPACSTNRIASFVPLPYGGLHVRRGEVRAVILVAQADVHNVVLFGGVIVFAVVVALLGTDREVRRVLRNRHRHGGFAVIEVLVVAVILAILVGIVIFAIGSATRSR
jgi:hypothetical protein